MPYYDHNKDYPFAAFITNLGKYNEGELVGEWVKFPKIGDKGGKGIILVVIVIWHIST